MTTGKVIIVAGMLLATLGAGWASDEQDVRIVGADGSARVSYVGDDIRVGVGVDDDGDFEGEYLHVFSKRPNSNWIGELWAGEHRGGVKLNYHWLRGASSVQDAAADQQNVRVGKVFAAVDRNRHDDRKFTLGLGFEGPAMFWGGYLMKSITGTRLIGETVDTQTEQLSGVIGNQQFVQDQFTDTITRFFEHPYEAGVGVRVGRYVDAQLLRLRAGLDYEQGRFGTDQATLSLGAEKFFADSGHSIALSAEYLKKSGQFEIDRSDVRGLLLYRYAFGQSYQPRRNLLERRTEVEVPPRPEQREKRLIKNEVTVSKLALFDLDRSAIRADVASALEGVAQQLSQLQLAGRVRITGHTCDRASDAYNQTLSQRRAEAVANFLAARGIDRGQMEIRALGESSPRVPNTSEASRERNRRVEIDFVSIEERTENVLTAAAVPGGTKVDWVRQEIDDPAWLERALRNPVRHKREVDTYRFEKVSTETRLGPQVVINTFPTAADDAVTTDQEVAVTIDVLANDTDPDGDSLTIVALSQPASGVAVLNADQTITYTPNSGFFGIDGFDYTVADSGGQSTAAVSINVLQRPPPQANDDAASTLRTQPVSVAVLANDQGQGLTISGASGAANGLLTVLGDQIVYAPQRAFVGEDKFSYQVTDEFGEQAEAQVTVTVAPFNQGPVAVDDSATTSKDTAVLIDVLANDSDPDGDPLKISAVTEVTPFGQVEITADNRVRYIPNPGWWGGDEFTYSIDDGFGGQASARVVLNVLE